MLKPLILLSLLQSALALQTDTWQPISVGLMMQRSLDASSSCPPEHSQLMKRAHRLSRRDYKQTVGSIQRMNAGGVLIPDEEGGEGQVDMTPSTVKNTSAKDHHVMVVNGTQRQHKREEGDGGFMSIITWYTGSDLLYPSCLSDGGWTPTDDSMIAAVTLNWQQKPPCGSFLELRRSKKDPAPTPTGKNKVDSIIVRVMDSCAGCKAGVPHVDLTKAAFKQLYALDIGYVTEIEVKLLSKPPFEKWGKQEEMLYGPEKLSKSKSTKSSPTAKNNNSNGNQPDWAYSQDNSWTSKNPSPSWTSNASPRVLASPTPQNQVVGKDRSQTSSGQGGNSDSSGSSASSGGGKMSGSVNNGSSNGGGGGPGGSRKRPSSEEDTSSRSSSGTQSDAWHENGWQW